MSSHHIIRENQEPALVMLTTIREEIFNQLLEWSPKVYCHFELLDWVIDNGFKIDVIIGPESSKTVSLKKMEYQIPIDYHSFKNSWTEILNKISNHTIHIASNINIDIRDLKSSCEIIRYSDEFKEFSFKGEWRKWKNRGDKIELSSEPEEMTNLEKSNSYFKVPKSGMVKIRSSNSIFIKEFFAL
ncbi:hypothetical protein HZR84_08400 [Hyphobacterium sp. CCMP332]|nr:hypothetical protein HZR84_08400 [Hyphobacterium sp. CCMP332]